MSDPQDEGASYPWAVVETRNTMEQRIAELEAELAGRKAFADKLVAEVRALQRRLANAGLDASIPGHAERESAS